MDRERLEVTLQESEDFFRKGYFVRRAQFSKSEVTQMLTSFDRLEEIAEGFQTPSVHENSQFVVEGERIDRIVWACGAEPRLQDFARDPRLTLPVALLLQSLEMNQIICQAHFKNPGDQVSFEWHQDSQHRGYGTADWIDINQKGSFVQTLVALDPCPKESGPVYFVDNTVSEGHLALDQKAVSSSWELSARPVCLEPGDTVYFHPFVVHGSSENLSNRPRRVFINGYAYPGANQRQYPGCGLGQSFTVDALIKRSAS